MEPLQYLERRRMMTYIADAIAVLAAKKRQDPKRNDIAVLSEYFQMLKVGAHVYGREFEFITATPYNRICFIRLFWQCFYALSRESVPMKLTEYLQMLRLLCPNFPADFLTKMNILQYSSKKACVDFEEFMYTFQVVLYYEKFLAESENLYRRLLAGAQDKPQVNIVVPRTDEAVPPTSQPPSEQNPPEPLSRTLQACKGAGGDLASESRITLSMFAEQVLDLRERLHKEEQWQCLPQSETLRHILFKGSRVTSVIDLLLRFMQSDAINAEIGIFPNRSDFQHTEPPPLPILPNKTLDSKLLIQAT